MNNQERFDIVCAIARKYDVRVIQTKEFDENTIVIQSFVSTPMIQDLKKEFFSTFFSGNDVPEIAGLVVGN